MGDRAFMEALRQRVASIHAPAQTDRRKALLPLNDGDYGFCGHCTGQRLDVPCDVYPLTLADQIDSRATRRSVTLTGTIRRAP